MGQDAATDRLASWTFNEWSHPGNAGHFTQSIGQV
jgi:hypothetical protein